MLCTRPFPPLFCYPLSLSLLFREYAFKFFCCLCVFEGRYVETRTWLEIFVVDTHKIGVFNAMLPNLWSDTWVSKFFLLWNIKDILRKVFQKCFCVYNIGQWSPMKIISVFLNLRKTKRHVSMFLNWQFLKNGAISVCNLLSIHLFSKPAFFYMGTKKIKFLFLISNMSCV